MQPGESFQPAETAPPQAGATPEHDPETEPPEQPEATQSPLPLPVEFESAEIKIGYKEKVSGALRLKHDIAAVRYISSDPKIVRVDEHTGEIYGAKRGTAEIIAEAENGDTARCSVTVAKEPSRITLSAERKTIGVGEELHFTAKFSTNAHSHTLRISSGDKKVLRVENGRVFAVGKGSARITVKTYNGKSTTLKVTVKPAPESVSFPQERYVLGIGEEIQLAAVLNSGSAGTCRYSGGNGSGSVDPEGRVTGHAIGEFTATVETHNGCTAACVIEVRPAPQSIALPVDSLEIGVKENIEGALIPQFDEGSAGSVSFKSSNTKILKVDAESGKLTGVATGKATVTVTSYNGLEACCEVTVRKAPSKVTLSVPQKTVSVGQVLTPAVKLSSGSCGAWKLTSSKPGVVAVEDNVTLRALDTGSAKITVKTYNGRSSSVTVKVVAAPSEIVPVQTHVRLPQGLSEALDFKVNKGSYTSFSYHSTHPEIASVDGAGCVAAHLPGLAEIVATTHNGLTAAVQVEVLPAPEAICFPESPLTIGVGSRHELAPLLHPENAVSGFEFESSDPKLVPVTSDGCISGLKKGSAHIRVTAYNGVSAELEVIVTDYYKTNPVSVIAHRGASGYYPDNTIAAIRHAAELGAAEVEIDVRKTKDGVLILHHDSTIKDGSKKREISQLSLKQIQKINPDVCTLDEALACIAETNMRVLIEFKVSGIEEKVLNCVEASALSQTARYASFKLDVLRKLHRLDESAQTVYLISDKDKLKDVEEDPDDYRSTTLSVKLELLSEKRIRMLHLAGKQVIAWTVNTRSDIEAARQMGVDGITTDYPDLV